MSSSRCASVTLTPGALLPAIKGIVLVKGWAGPHGARVCVWVADPSYQLSDQQRDEQRGRKKQTVEKQPTTYAARAPFVWSSLGGKDLGQAAIPRK